MINNREYIFFSNIGNFINRLKGKPHITSFFNGNVFILKYNRRMIKFFCPGGRLKIYSY